MSISISSTVCQSCHREPVQALAGCFEICFFHGCLCASCDSLSPAGEIRLEFARPRERTITSCQSLTPPRSPHPGMRLQQRRALGVDISSNEWMLWLQRQITDVWVECMGMFVSVRLLMLVSVSFIKCTIQKVDIHRQKETHTHKFIYLELHSVQTPSSMKSSKQTPMVQVTNKLSDLVTTEFRHLTKNSQTSDIQNYCNVYIYRLRQYPTAEDFFSIKMDFLVT